jgi:hypothetical protein
MALLEINKIKKDISILFGYVKCLMNKEDETSPLSATEWSSNHSVVFGNPYMLNCFVWYSGHVYKSLVNNNIYPPTNATYWVDLGEGHQLLEEQTDWDATTGRALLKNKPTNTSDFVNDGEDSSSPFATINDLNAAIPSAQNLESVLNEGNISFNEGAYVKEIGVYDDFNSPTVPAGFAKIFSSLSRLWFQNKIGSNMFSIAEGFFTVIKGAYEFRFSFANLTTNRIATFQNNSGVVAYLTDIPELPLTNNYGLFSQIVEPTPVTGITEGTLIGTGLGSLVIPANMFQVGNSFALKIYGKISCANNQQLVINLKSDSVVLGTTDTIVIPTTTNKDWELSAQFTIRAIGLTGVAILQTNGRFTYNKNSSNAFEGICFNYTNNTTFNTTIANTLGITAVWLTSNATNSIHSHQLTLNKTY